ncbi:MAG: hypothetical protein Kow0099_10070 [Candidatus Abyssubacteria bacterium]
MDIPEIFEKRLLLISGKGGVGKSTVCAALALSAARLGKRVLLVEMDEKERMARLFGRPSVGYHGAYVYEDIYAMNLLPIWSMDEFVRVQVKPKRLAEQILGSQIYRYFVAAAPGLKEFVTLGKIMLLEEETLRGGKPKYDLIIVDAPATGHGVAFLRVPFAAADAVKAGWVRKQADRIIDLVTDPARTALNIVTLPEEMPVNETMEMCESVNTLLHIPIGYVIVNSVFPKVLEDDDHDVYSLMKKRARSNGLSKLTPKERETANAMFECFESAIRRRELSEFYLSKLKRMLEYDLLEIPFIFTKSFDIELIRQVSDYIMDELLRGSD